MSTMVAVYPVNLMAVVLLFQVILKKGGQAELRARRTLNCEKRKSYKFDIAAVSCKGVQSDK